MTQKLRFIGSAALGILFAWGAQLALAQGVEQRGSAQKGAVVRVAPVSRPLNADLFPRPDSLIATALTESECTGLGGKVTEPKPSLAVSST